MSDEGNRDTLYIPAGLKTQREIYSGFGKKELRQAIIATLVIAAIDVFVSLLILNNLAIFVIVLFLGVFMSVMCVQKDTTNLSVLDMVTNLYNYLRSQKKYYYKAIDEWRWKV